MAQFNKYKKEINEIKKAEPSALTELYVQLDHTRQNVKHYDVLLKRTRDPEEWDKLIIERRKAYNEYLALKSEVKKAEVDHHKGKLRSRDMER